MPYWVWPVMFACAFLALLSNSAIIYRLTIIMGKHVRINDACWMTLIGVIGNSTGLPIGSGVKYLFWHKVVGLSAAKIFKGMLYFSFICFWISFVGGLFTSIAGGYELKLANVLLFLFVVGLICISLLFYRIEGWVWSVKAVGMDCMFPALSAFGMASLFVMPIINNFPDMEVFQAYSISLFFLAITYLSFSSAFPGGQEILLGGAAKFLGEPFLLGVGLALLVRAVFIIVAAIMILGLQPITLREKK